MFSTLLGPLPPDPDAVDSASVDRVRSTLGDLEAAGLELLSDGEAAGPSAVAPSPEEVVERWRRAAEAAAPRPVKAVVPGPYSWSRSPAAGDASAAGWAEALQPAIAALAEAGCPFVEVDEPDALAIAVVGSELRRFVDAHRRLTDEIKGVHLSLALTGGNLDAAGPAAFFDLPYASFAFDLIAGPDNWRLIAAAPADRGIVCGALSPLPGGEMSREVLVWAAHYAASTNGRGLERVGLANASSLAGLSRPEALARLAIVAEAARIAAMSSVDEQARQLDPRAIPVPRAVAAADGVAPPALPARRSAVWALAFRVMYRGLRLLDPLIRSWIAAGSPGLDGVVELRYAGRRTGRARSTLVTILDVDGRWYIGHPNGPAAWVRNVAADGFVEIEPAGPLGARFAVVPLGPGPERDAVIRATWTQQPFPANLIYRAARRHVAAVGVYHRLEPVPGGSEGVE